SGRAVRKGRGRDRDSAVTVGKNTGWGTRGALPDGAPIVSSDTEARHLAETARRAGEPVPVMGLIGGDLARTVGASPEGERLHSAQAMTLPMDLGSVLIDGRQHWFVAHLVVRRSW